MPNIFLSKEGNTFKFTALHARDKAPLICYFDTESKLTPSNDIKNAVHKHETKSCNYVLVDK